VEIDPGKYFENTLNILRHLTRVEQNNLGCRVNKTMWNTAPAVVNAYYSRNKNQISELNGDKLTVERFFSYL
jgi:membrane metallo-endopeptidase-like protein 1